MDMLTHHLNGTHFLVFFLFFLRGKDFAGGGGGGGGIPRMLHSLYAGLYVH